MSEKNWKRKKIWLRIQDKRSQAGRKKIGAKKAADELGIPDNTLYGWVRAANSGHLNVGTGYRTPEDNLNLAEENAKLRKQLKEQEKEITRLNELYGARTFYRYQYEGWSMCKDS